MRRQASSSGVAIASGRVRILDLAKVATTLARVLKLVLDLLVPSTFAVLIAVAGGVLLLLGRRGCRLGTVLLGAGVAVLALALLLPLDVWLLGPLEDRFPPSSPPAHVDGVVVLGGGLTAALSADRRMPTLNRDADRLVAFAELARRYPGAKLVFAGGPGPRFAGDVTEAAASETLLAALGLDTRRILVDDQSHTTWENAVNALALARPRAGETWLLVTSASHMPRAMGAFHRAGWPAMVAWPVAYRTLRSGAPAILQPMSAKLAAIDLAAHEWTGLLAYRMEGRSDQLFPSPQRP